jgi:FMN-dependent NADH-azoreductase
MRPLACLAAGKWCTLIADMATVLYIESSPLKQRSHTIEVAHAFLDAYRQARPEDTIETIDLWAQALPPFDGATIEAKFAVLRGNDFTALQQERWSAVREVARRFNAADKYVFGVPMWNFGVPYPLKHYIDVVTLAGENWTWTRTDGYRALLWGKRAMLIYSSAGAYELTVPPHSADFQKPFLRHWLSFIGVKDIVEINIAPTLTDAAAVAQVKHEAHARARALARTF